MKELSVHGSRNDTLRRLFFVLFALMGYAGLTVMLYRSLSGGRQPHGMEGRSRLVADVGQPPPRRMTTQAGQFRYDGKPYLIRAVGWDPVRPGELPWQRGFHPEELRLDLERIAAAGFNTVRTWAPLDSETLKLVEERGLHVMQGIWIPPDGDFASPEFRAEQLEMVQRVVASSRWSRAVIGYLILNEPRAEAVARSGIDATIALLREVSATIRAADPDALVGYASWPGLEVLDDPALDFVAFNLYAHRPRVVMQELGLPGYVALLQRSIARGRPFFVSEFGVSVSPQQSVPGRGGASEQEQADQLRNLTQQFLSQGVAGYSVFQWSDGWWKQNDGDADEQTHDPDDPEEWFGLVAFEDLKDRKGRLRPAYHALARFQKALPEEPAPAVVEPSNVKLSIEPRRLTVSPAHQACVRVRAGGPPAAGKALTVVAYTEDRFNEEVHRLQTGDDGYADVCLTAPDSPTVLTVLAVDAASSRSAERSAAWAAVEVRSPQ